MAKARLRRGIEMVKLANRIEALKMRDEDPDAGDLPTSSAIEGITAAGTNPPAGSGGSSISGSGGNVGNGGVDGTDGAGGAGGAPGQGRLARAARSAIFREVVLAKVKEMKADQETAGVGGTASAVKHGEPGK